MSKLDDVCYRMYENSGNSEYIRAEWAGRSYHPDQAKKEIKDLMLELTQIDPKTIDKGNEMYNHDGKVGATEYKNGFNLAVAIIQKKVEEL